MRARHQRAGAFRELPLRTASAALLGQLLSFAGWGSTERRFKPAAT